MEPRYIRIFDKSKDKEILLKVNTITEIHIEYATVGKVGEKKVGFSVGSGEGRQTRRRSACIQMHFEFTPLGVRGETFAA